MRRRAGVAALGLGDAVTAASGPLSLSRCSRNVSIVLLLEGGGSNTYLLVGLPCLLDSRWPSACSLYEVETLAGSSTSAAGVLAADYLGRPYLAAQLHQCFVARRGCFVLRKSTNDHLVVCTVPTHDLKAPDFITSFWNYVLGSVPSSVNLLAIAEASTVSVVVRWCVRSC